MDPKELRTRIKNYIEHADERVLRIFYTIIEVEKEYFPDLPRKELSSPIEHSPNNTDNEKSNEEGIGSLKDDHRLK